MLNEYYIIILGIKILSIKTTIKIFTGL
jgi:hypothetical protein